MALRRSAITGDSAARLVDPPFCEDDDEAVEEAEDVEQDPNVDENTSRESGDEADFVSRALVSRTRPSTSSERLASWRARIEA